MDPGKCLGPCQNWGEELANETNRRVSMTRGKQEDGTSSLT